MSNHARKEPLLGFLPRNVGAKQVTKAMEGEVNPFTKKPHTPQYKKILESRKRLPMFAQMPMFYDMVSPLPVVVPRLEIGFLCFEPILGSFIITTSLTDMRVP